MWVLGFKTEGPTTDFFVREGAHLELLGGELNRFRGQSPGDEWDNQPSFELENIGGVSVVATEYGPNPPLREIYVKRGHNELNVTRASFPVRDHAGGGAVDIVMPSWSA